MAQLPISAVDAGNEIKALITEKGLDVITSKMVRKHLEAKFICPLEEFKTEIDELIESCIYEMEIVNTERRDVVYNTIENNTSEALAMTSESESDLSSKDLSDSMPNRKRKANTKLPAKTEHMEDDDMASVVKRRRSAAHPAAQRKREKEKTKKEKKAGGKRNSAFSKICVLSPELASLLGKNYMRRSDVVKAMWAYFRSNNLMDVKNKQYVILDESLKRVFGNKTRIKAFGMMSDLKKHVKDVAMLDDSARTQAEADIALILEQEAKALSEEMDKQLDNNNENSIADDSNSDEFAAKSEDPCPEGTHPSTSSQPAEKEKTEAPSEESDSSASESPNSNDS